METEGTIRKVGVFTAACVLVSNAVGSGIFTTTGFMARDLGDPFWILGLWALGGLLSLAGAMSYSELGAAIPHVGGEYVYLRRAYGPIWGFLSGWISFTIGFSAAIAAAAIGFTEYLGVLIPGFPVPPVVSALVLVWGITLIHALGVEHGGNFQRWITIAKIGGITFLIVGAFALGGGAWSNFETGATGVRPPLGPMSIALVFVLYSYTGWNAAGYIAGEIERPGRNLPLAMIGGTLFIGLLYLAVNITYFYALPIEALAADPVLPVAEKAATALGGVAAGKIVSIVLCISIAGATSSMIWAGPRVTLAMARDRVVPDIFSRTTEAHAPLPALFLQAAWISVLLFSGSFEQLVVYGGVALALASALAVSSVIVLRIREPELERPYRVWPYPWVPLAFVAASLLIAGSATLARPTEALLSIGTVALGAPIYWIWTRWLRGDAADSN